MMRCAIVVSLIAILLGGCGKESGNSDQPLSSCPVPQPVSSESSADSKSGSPHLGGFVSFPTCGIKIRQPEGLEKSDSFDGFGSPESQASIMAISVPGPYLEVTAGLTKERMKAQGWTLLSKQDIKVDGLPGILVHFEQPAGGKVFLKWSLAFGDDRKTTMVTAAVPKLGSGDLSDRLKAALLSVRLNQASSPDLGADLPFTLVASPKLKLTPGINRTMLFTKDGVIPAKSPKDPLFIAARSLGDVAAENKQRFAEQRIRGTAETKGLVVKSNEAISVDGLEGYETLAEAQDAESGTPLLVYQVILFDEKSYILMQGLVGTDLRDEILPEFKVMARSLRRKQP